MSLCTVFRYFDAQDQGNPEYGQSQIRAPANGAIVPELPQAKGPPSCTHHGLYDIYIVVPAQALFGEYMALLFERCIDIVLWPFYVCIIQPSQMTSVWWYY